MTHAPVGWPFQGQRHGYMQVQPQDQGPHTSGLHMLDNWLHKDRLFICRFESLPPPLAASPWHWIATPAALQSAVSALRTAACIAVDIEHNASRSYLGLTCLVRCFAECSANVIKPEQPTHADLSSPDNGWSPVCFRYSCQMGIQTM